MRRSSFLSALALLAGCGAAPEPEWEQQYWAALHSDQGRDAVYQSLGALAPSLSGAERARAHFLRGTLGMAMSLEDARTDLIMQVTPDLEQAVTHDPAAGKYPPWLHTMDMVLTYIAGDTAGFARASDAAVASIALYPTGNALSVGGTFSGFPLSTGLPRRAIELADQWRCDQDWCAHNTARAPWSQPGLHYHFGDAYARTGDRARALSHFSAALTAEGADRWPHRKLAEHAVSNIDQILASYRALGDDRHAIFLVYANSKQGCSLCHGM